MATLPETGISLSLVKQALGAASNELSALCRHANINMFSRHKPVVYPGIPSGTGFWRAMNRNFGIVIPEIDSGSEAVIKTAWHYQRPSGGENSPYRLGDFRGYNHQAKPVLERIGNDFNLNLADNAPLTITFTTPGEISAEEIGIVYSAEIGDMLVNSLGGLCLAAKIKDKEGNTLYTVYSPKNISSGGLTLTAYPSALPPDTYELYFFLATPDQKHAFPFYKNDSMPNPCTLTIIRSLGFDFTVSGLVDSAGKRHLLSERIQVYFCSSSAYKRKGFYIIASVRNTSPKELILAKKSFSVTMRPDLFAGGEQKIILYGALLVDPNDPTITIETGQTAEIGFYFNKYLSSTELLPFIEDVRTSVSYNGQHLWTGTVYMTTVVTDIQI